MIQYTHEVKDTLKNQKGILTLSKKRLYMVLDTETATLPFANEIAKGDKEKKKRIAIARPLIYHLAYTITDRLGEIYKTVNLVISEIFCVPAIFDTAYYAEKRPLYIEMLNNGEAQLVSWLDAMRIFEEDLKLVDAVGAFNAMFDFKKAIPFTELYIKKLYSNDYYNWEEVQKKICYSIANTNYKKDNDKVFEPDIFNFRGEKYPLFDLWGLAAEHLLNNSSYKKECLNHGLLTNSGVYFKTSAESTYQYLCKKYDFVEAHTALDDAIIETFILSKIAKKHAISIGIDYFPFRKLGTTNEFCMRRKVPNIEECTIVINAINSYIDAQEECNNYVMGLINKIAELEHYMGQ